MMERDYLKPCPFCGAPGKLLFSCGMYIAHCENALECVRTMPYKDKSEVIGIWNRRVQNEYGNI